MVHQHALRFIVSEVKIPFGCSPKAKAIQSRVRKRFKIFGTKSTSSRIPTIPRRDGMDIVCVDFPDGQYKTRTVDYGRLGIKHGLGYKTWPKHYELGIKMDSGIKRGLRTYLRGLRPTN